MTKSKTENIKSERIFVRLFPNEKAELEAKAKAENLTISEYVRQSILNSKVVQISKEERSILNKASINFNQLLRTINEEKLKGLPISKIENAIEEWSDIVSIFRELIQKYDSRKPKK